MRWSRRGLNEGHATTGDLDIRDDVTISGAGAADTIIDAASLDRVFHVFADASLTLDGVTITGGLASPGVSHGGGIQNANGTLTVLNSSAANKTVQHHAFNLTRLPPTTPPATVSVDAQRRLIV